MHTLAYEYKYSHWLVQSQLTKSREMRDGKSTQTYIRKSWKNCSNEKMLVRLHSMDGKGTKKKKNMKEKKKKLRFTECTQRNSSRKKTEMYPKQKRKTSTEFLNFSFDTNKTQSEKKKWFVGFFFRSFLYFAVNENTKTVRRNRIGYAKCMHSFIYTPSST